MFLLPSHVKIFKDTTKTYINRPKHDQTLAVVYRLAPNLTLYPRGSGRLGDGTATTEGHQGRDP